MWLGVYWMLVCFGGDKFRSINDWICRIDNGWYFGGMCFFIVGVIIIVCIEKKLFFSNLKCFWIVFCWEVVR